MSIFEMYADGLSLKQICTFLDDADVPTPGSSTRRRKASIGWNPSTLSGDVQRGEGILNNRLYIGERIFNRRRYIEEPDGKGGIRRRPRDNDPSVWKIRAAPELRIVSDELSRRVKERQSDERSRRDAKFKLTGNPLSGAKRPTYLLSGLVNCGGCGNDYVASGGGRWRCRVNFRKGACANNRSITTVEPEGRVLEGVRKRLLTPELIGRYARLLQKEVELLNRQRKSGRRDTEERLAETRRRIGKLVQQIEGDDEAPRSLIRRLKELEEEEERLVGEIEQAPEADVIQIPSNYARIYEQAIVGLEKHLLGDDAARARDTIRALIEKVVIRPSGSRLGGIALELHGDLFQMLDFAQEAAGAAPKKPTARNDNGPQLVAGGRMTSLVAGAGFEPATFRL